jgi:hypothetical protein
MDVQQAPTTVTESRERHSSARLHGRWLLLARGTWVALVVLTLTIFFASLPVYPAQLQTPCAGSACGFQQLTPDQAGALKGMGLSLAYYTASTVVLTLASVVLCLVVSTLIVWRRSDDRMALLVALLLVTNGPLAVTFNVSASPSPWQVPNECLSFLFLALFMLVFSLFPIGQFVPRWIRWTLVVFLGEATILVVAQLYRYRRVSSPVQRQQTKWVVFGFAVPTTVYVLGIVPYLMFSVLSSPGSLYLPAFVVVQDFLQLLFPLSFGFAMLRARLWDIDVLINRTLVYGALTVTMTGILALVYLGSIIAIQALFRGLFQQASDVAIVVSILVIYALFQPVHTRIQTLIDRRFYRRKYDAAKVVAAFSATLRHEVELDQLREHLVTVAQETMQPTFVSLWLCPPEPARKRKTWLLARSDEQERGEPGWEASRLTECDVGGEWSNGCDSELPSSGFKLDL